VQSRLGVAEVVGQHNQADAGAGGHELVDQAAGAIHHRGRWRGLSQPVRRVDPRGARLPANQQVPGQVGPRPAAVHRRDADTWGVHLLDVAEQGLRPDYTIADAGQGLRTGQRAAWGDTPCHGDVFHIQRQCEGLANTLQRLATGATSRRKALQAGIRRAGQRDHLLAFAGVLDAKLAAIARAHTVPEPLVREACVLHRLPTTSPAYWQGWNRLRAQTGSKFHVLFDAVSRAMADTPRSSSLVENLNSRLRTYFTLRRHLGSPCNTVAPAGSGAHAPLHLVLSRTRLIALGFMRCRIRGGGVATSVVVGRRLVVSHRTVRLGLPLASRQDARGLGLVVHYAASFPFERTPDVNAAAMGRIARKVITDAGIGAAGGCDVIARRPEGEFSGPR